MTGIVDRSDSAVLEGRAEDGVTRQNAGPRRTRAVLSDLFNSVRTRFGAVPLVEVLALVPVLAMLGAVLGGSKMQLPDYWIIAPETFNGDGSLAKGSLLSYYNGHILAVPKVLFWLNYELSSGLNTTLGLWVTVIGVGLILAMRALLPRGPRLGRWASSLLVVGIAVLVFAPQGTHNYVMSMSGASWILANLFMVAAVWVTARRPLGEALPVAIPLAILATLTYGTGLMTWPALLVVAFLMQRWSRAYAILIGASVAALGSYFWWYERPTAHGQTGPDIIDMARRSAQVVGSVMAPDEDTAALVGVAALVLGGFLIWRAVLIDRIASAPWVAVVVYAVLGAAMIGVARGGGSDTIGAEPRYTPVSAMFWCGLLVLAVWLWPKDVRVSLTALVVVGMAFVGGRADVARVEERNFRLEEAAIAMRLDTVHNYPPAPPYAPNAYEESREYVREFEHYPFSDAFDSDCGMLGQQLDAGAVADAEDAVATSGEVYSFLQPYNRDSVRIDGWTFGVDGVRCVLVVDQDLVVVGAAAYGAPLTGVASQRGFGTNEIGFAAVAPMGMDTYRIVAVVGSDDQLVLLPGELRGVDAPSHLAGSATETLDDELQIDDDAPDGDAEPGIGDAETDVNDDTSVVEQGSPIG